MSDKVAIPVVKVIEVTVRPGAGPQTPGEYWWEVVDANGTVVDSVYTETAGDEESALKQAVDAAEELLDEAPGGWWMYDVEAP